MGLKNSRPLPQACAELHVAPFLQRRIRSWHLDHVTQLALLRYRSLTKRFCVDALQLSAVLGIKDEAFVRELMALFLPRTPTRVQCMVDAMEVLIALALVCQAASMRSRFEAIFDIVDINCTGCITTTDLVVLLGAVGRAIMKIFCYAVEPDAQAAVIFVNAIAHSGIVVDGKVTKSALCKYMLSDKHAVHYVKLCTGEDKPKLYVMLEKDTAFIGAIQFSDEHHMRTASLKTVREMVHAQVHRAPPDFAFLCQGRDVKRVWEVDRLAWSTVPFALHGSPGLRVRALAANRALEQPASGNCFEFRYMGNVLPRYKKRVHEIAPVYTHRSFHLVYEKTASSFTYRGFCPGRGSRIRAVLQWRVASNWSGEWVFGQEAIAGRTKRDVQQRLRTALRPLDGAVVVKSHRGELIAPLTDSQSALTLRDLDGKVAPSTAVTPPAAPPSSSAHKRAPTMTLQERKSESARRHQRIQWKARVIAMEAQQRKDEHEDKRTPSRAKEDGTRAADTAPPTPNTVLVHVEEDDVLPSRLVPTHPKKRPRPRKKRFSKYEWHVPSRRQPLLRVNAHKLVVKLLSEQIVLAPAAGDSSDRQRMDIGPFLASSNICLESDEVEVFPVLWIRPIEPHVAISTVAAAAESATSEQMESDADAPELLASESYLSEFEYDLSASETNYEALLHHIRSAAMQDALALNRQDVFGRTMLHDAAEFGHANVLELLLQARVLLNVRDRRGDTALHHAARCGRLKEVSLLLRERAVAWQHNDEGKSPLLCALETAARVLSARAREAVTRPTTQRGVVLGGERCDAYYATHHRYPKLRQVIDLLWDRYPVHELAAADRFDRQSCLSLERAVYGDLFHACRTGNLVRVQRLMDLEKRPIQQYINDQLEALGRTALHEATELGHTAIVDLLLKVGADGYICDQGMQLPLHIAATKGHERIATCLIAAFPGTLGVQDASGKTPLHLAIEWQRWRVALALVHAIEAHDVRSSAASRGEMSPADVVADVLNLQDMQGFTPLHYACVHGNEALSLELLRAGASLHVSRVAHTVFSQRHDLFGVRWKTPALFRGAGIDSSVSGIRSWLVRDSSTSADVAVAFDIDAPAESLLKGCKRRPERVSVCKRILDALLLSVCAAEERAKRSTSVSRMVKTSLPPLLHLAADIAPVHMSVAVELCRHLAKLHVEINMLHARTGDTVLLQECKRVCALRQRQQRSDLSDDGADASTHLALVRTLIELGANVNLANGRTGETPLGCAAWFGHLALLDLLLETQPDRDYFVRAWSFTPLHFAALGGHVACAKRLLAARATVNTETLQAPSDETPLFFAIRSKCDAMVQLLLDSGANIGTLCAARRGRTSFGVSLDLTQPREALHVAHLEKMPTFGPSQRLLDTALASAAVVSPLTFALDVARTLAPFGRATGSMDRLGDAQTSKHDEWTQLGRICLLLATRLGESTATSGLLTRRDVHCASMLGYWDVVQELLTHQVVLSSISTVSTMNALHYAAAAGETAVVSALVAAGMDVNCVVVRARLRRRQRIVSHHSNSSRSSPKALAHAPARRQGTRTRIKTLHWNIGALYFALVRGHVETAAKLLVLGASPLATLPYIETATHHLRQPANDAVDIQDVSAEDAGAARAISFVVSEWMQKDARTQYILRTRDKRRHRHVDPAIHFVRHLERSIDEATPLLQLQVAAGYAGVVQLLVRTGSSVFQLLPSASVHGGDSTVRSRVCETAVHAAVAHGHMALLQDFARLAQFDFPSCFVRESKKPTSLLVVACEHRQLSALTYLLQTGSAESGGGFRYEEQPDEFQHALRACATHQFVDGFHLLLAHGAQPDLHVLVTVLQGIVEPLVPETLTAPAHVPERKRPCKAGGRTRLRQTTAKRMRRRDAHPTRARNSVAHARTLLDAIVPFMRDLDAFVSTAMTFDNALKVLIVCARCELWFVLEALLVAHAARFVDASSPWKPIIVRAASCCLVLHRAALHNRVELVRFVLALGVPADLRLSEMPAARSPIWYAASRGSLEAFVVLALAIESQSLAAVVASLDYNSRSRRFALFFRTIQDSRSFAAPGSLCKWHSLSAMSCYDVSRAHTRAFVIQKLLAYARRESKGRGNTLLHFACAHGEVLTVETLLQSGADMRATNARNETPLVLAAARQDAHGTAIVRYLLAAMAATKTADDAAAISRALVRCFAQPAPCNLRVAKVLLAAGADVAFALPQDESACSPTSAMQCALESVQFSCVKLLLDHGAVLSTALVEVFLTHFVMAPSFERTRHWRRFAEFLAFKEQRLVEVEGVMALLLEKRHGARAMTEDLLHQLVKCAAAIAATLARVLGMEKRFWSLVTRALETYPTELRACKAEWGDCTALHYAVLELERDIVAQLLNVGAYDILAQDHKKQTPLHFAAVTGDAPICALLLRTLEREPTLRGVDATDARGRTPLHIAVIHGNDAVAELLVSAGASLELRCVDGWNALLYACKCNRLSILMALAKCGSSRTLLYTPTGESGLFVAAQRGAFQIVRWLASAQLEEHRSIVTLRCLSQRSLLHYASIFGDSELVHQHLEAAATGPLDSSNHSHSDSTALIDARDAAGYTPLHYAFGFGRVQAFELLLTAGANADAAVDHSNEARTHPYASPFTVASLLEWFAFPGWYTFASTCLLPREKRRVTTHETINESYLMNSSSRRWKLGKPAPTAVARKRERSAIATRRLAFKTVRTTMRQWRFPQLSLFDYVCDVGDAAMAAFLVNMRLPLLLRRSTYQSQRRNMLQAVRWNRLDVVQSLLAATELDTSKSLTEATRHTDGLHFHDFVEVALDCAVSRGHEDLAMCLLEHWRGVKGTGRADAGVFAFQFAHVLQLACIRRMTKLIAYMIARGGEEVVAFHEHDGPALVYAVGFGHVDVVAMLLGAGAHFSSLHTFIAPSVKKWAALGGLEAIQLPPQSATSVRQKRAVFEGPLGTYDAAAERLTAAQVCAAFAPPAQRTSGLEAGQRANE